MSWGAVIGGAVAVGTSMMSSDAAANGVASQERGAAASDATQRYMFDTNRGDNMPYLRNGTAASNKLAYLSGVGDPSGSDAITQAYRDHLGRDPHPSELRLWAQYGKNGMSDGDIQTGISLSPEAVENGGRRIYTPTAGDGGFDSLNRRFSVADLASDVTYQTGLQFGLDEGAKGVNNQASATGSLLSGATLKALSKFGTDYGATKAEGAYNRYTQENTNTYNRLAGIAGSGQTASAQIGAAGTNYANNVSQTAQGLGNARAASGIASANATSGALTGAFNNYQRGELLKALQKRPGTYTSDQIASANAWNVPTSAQPFTLG